MKIWILSDLHLEFQELNDIEIPNADVCVIAGDVRHGGPARSVRWIGQHIAKRMPTVFVCGNHEYYQASVKEGLFEGSLEASNYPGLHMLENASVEIGGVLFAGTTLWTDFEIMGGSAEAAMWHAARVMNDFSEIAYSKRPFSRLRPHQTLQMHRASRRFLESFLDGHRDRRTVVVTHHAPSRNAILPTYAADLTTAAFVSDLEGLIQERGPTIWVHGHVHHRYDCQLGRTRLLCNPRGYPGDPSFEVFESTFVVEV